MKRLGTYEIAKELRRIEIRELKEAVREYGGEVVFTDGDDDDDEDKIQERPCVMVNTKYCGPQDADIYRVSLDEDGDLEIEGQYKESFDRNTIPAEDIAVGHIGFITDLIPRKPDLRKLQINLGVTIEVTEKEAEEILICDTRNAYAKFLLREIIDNGHFELNGKSIIPRESIEDYNAQNNTQFIELDAVYEF